MAKLMGVLLAGLMLVGCATTKPEMSNDMYQHVARTHVAIEYCNRQGWISPDVAATGKRGIESKINQYTYDYERLNNEVKWINGFKDKPNQGDCNKLAMEIQGYNQINQIQNKQTDTDIQFRNTTCNRMGTQTFCTTY